MKSGSAANRGIIKNSVIHSEQSRTRFVIVMLSFVAIYGIYRTVLPIVNSVAVGLFVFSVTLFMLLFEYRMLRVLVRCETMEQNEPHIFLRSLQLILECLYPIVLMVLLLAFTPVNPYLLLVSPAYILILILIAASVLRLRSDSTFLCGIFGTISYGVLVLYVVNHAGRDIESPFAIENYFVLVFLLLLTTGVSVYITRLMRQYLDLAVTEVETRRQHELVQKDLEIARGIQQSLLPGKDAKFSEYELAGFSRAALKTGGDYYDWQLLDNSHLILTIADATGHGIGPALMTTACRAYMRAILDRQKEPEVLMQKLNRLIHEDMPAGKFVTFALVDLDFNKHEVLFLSAGHAPHLLIRDRTGEVEKIGAQGIPLGISDHQDFDPPVIRQIEKNDILVMLSDGVFEVENKKGKKLGLVQLTDCILKKKHLPAVELVDEISVYLDNYLEGQLPGDDMTLVIIKRI
ncbi:MAG TPA: SpoIIE family protein phosphatase [Gammaproteobacteria bacterium]|nr:SpoIIE family protein phosphatase [Gammaproteobacteria bacterium]